MAEARVDRSRGVLHEVRAHCLSKGCTWAIEHEARLGLKARAHVAETGHDVQMSTEAKVWYSPAAARRAVVPSNVGGTTE